MTQEFHLSVTPVRENEYLVRTEDVAPGVPLAEEQVLWSVEDWLSEARLLMDDPLLGLLSNQNLSSGLSSLSLPSSTEALSINLAMLGQRLYGAVFQGTIRDSWMTAQGIAQHRRERLRFRLGLKGTRLHRLPWEVLYAGDRPLATGTDVVFSRYHSSFAIVKSHLSYPKPFPSESPHTLKILMVLAVPADQDALALKQEAEQLKQELQASSSGTNQLPGIELTILEQPGREQLTQALEHNHYQVLHYAGHSNLSAAGGNLYLVNRRTGLSETLSGDDLAGLLVNNGIRMAVFNSCRGGYSATAESSSEAEGNLAEALVKRGIPAVLAMAERIPDEVALNLSRLFYRNLKQGYPVDLSLSRSRQGLISSYGSDQLYWALPILYLHPKFDGYLQSIPASAVHHGMSLDAPSSGLYDGNEDQGIKSAEIPQLRPNELSAPPRSQPRSHPLDSFSSGSNSSTVPSSQPEVEMDEEYLLDFDELEFEDLEFAAEEDDVIKLVNALEEAKELEQAKDLDPANQFMYEVSHSPTVIEPDEPWLPAVPGEDLLSDGEADTRLEDYWTMPDSPSPDSPSPDSPSPDSPSMPPSDEAGGYSNRASAPFSGSLGDRTATATIAQPVDVKIYAELETVLAEMGTLTEAIAAGNRAVQANPTSAEAYTQLGWALYQQGYLTEAIAVYQQALHLNSTLPLIYNRLGLALYQQGNLSEAVQAYTQAVQLDPDYTDASNNLKALLYRPTVSNSSLSRSALPAPLPKAPPIAAPTSPPLKNQINTQTEAPPATETKPRRSLFWLGSGIFALSALLSGWAFHAQILDAIPLIPLPKGISPATPTSSGKPDLSQTSSAALVTLATDQISQGNLDLAQPAIELLLDRRSRKEAEAVLKTVSRKDAANPAINFLKGRLAWELWLADDRAYSVQKAREFWDAGLKAQPNPRYQNALGFAYYAEGKFALAEQAWLQALILSGEKPLPGDRSNPSPTVNPTPNPETLQSYAGLALASLKLADKQPLEKQAAGRSVALKLRQKVITADPVNFTPAALGLNWMWSEKTIQDWERLLAIK